MLKKPITCNNCVLEPANGGFSLPEGTGSNGVLIIGESLGKNELNDGLPFRPYAEAGSILQSVFKRLGLNRRDFLLSNLIRCQPPFNALEGTDYERDSIEHCQVHFNQMLMQHSSKIKVILALGNLPMRYLCPEVMNLYQAAIQAKDKSQLKKLAITSLRGYIFDSKFKGIKIISSLHPSFIRRTGSIYSGVLLRDLFIATELAKGNVPVFKPRLILNPTIEEGWAFYNKCKQRSSSPIFYDIETPTTTIEPDESEVEFQDVEVKDIISVQFSIDENEGIFLDWLPFKEVIAAILKLPNSKMGWNNREFDNTHLKYHLGVDTINGQIVDLMMYWKFVNPDFSKLGRGLQFATNFYCPEMPAWKHLADDEPRIYGCNDVIAPNKIARGLDKDFSEMKLKVPFPVKTIQEGFFDDVVKLMPILDDITKRGLPIDVVERTKFAKRLDGEVEATLDRLQETYPFELRNISPKLGYINVPKEIPVLIGEFKEKFCDPIKSETYVFFPTEEAKEFYLSKYIEENSRIKDDKKDNSGLILREIQLNGFSEKRWCRYEKFKPNSKDQVLEYIKLKMVEESLVVKNPKNRVWYVPKKKNYYEGDKETTSKDEIHELWEATGDPFLEDVVLFREFKKMRTTYLSDKKKKGKKQGWALGDDNRIHAKFEPKPATGQLSSVIHNAPARGTRFSSKGYAQLAKDFRKIVAAKPGHVILSADWSSFHALTLAFEAEDATYMRLVRSDVHSFVAAHILNTELPRSYEANFKSKPISWTNEEYIAWMDKTNEALSYLKSIDTWLSLSDDDLKRQLKWFKNNYGFTRNSQAKPAILGMGFGMKVGKFYELNRYSFKSKSEPEVILKLIKGLFPKAFVKYHEYIKDLADQQTYLLTRYGYIRRFYDVYDWRLISKMPRSLKEGQIVRKNNRTGELWLRKDGEDSNAAIAFNPANCAFGKKKESIRDFWEHPNGNLVKSYGLVNEIHDDLVFEIDENLVSEAIPIIKNVMESPARFLKNDLCKDGLVCKVEIKIGKNWGELHTI